MKKTRTLLALAATAALLFIGCKNNNAQLLLGTFSKSTQAQTDLFENEEPDSPVVISCSINQTIELSFTETGDYTLSIKQNASDIELYDVATFTLGDINSYFNRDITISGKYIAKNNKITLTNEAVTLGDGQVMDFIEYQELDPTVGAAVQTVKYTVNENELSLNASGSSITYTRK